MVIYGNKALKPGEAVKKQQQTIQNQRPDNFKQAGVKIVNPGILSRSVDNALRSGGQVGNIDMQRQLKIARLNQQVYAGTITPEEYARRTSEASTTFYKQAAKRTIDFSKDGPSASELREQGNAEIKAAQLKEVQRLGGTSIKSGNSGPTKISQTLVDDTPTIVNRNVSKSGSIKAGTPIVIAEGIAAKSQTQSQFGFTEETKMFGFSSTGSFEETRQKDISFYKQQVMLKEMGLTVDINQLNEAGLSTLYNQQIIQKDANFSQPKRNYLYSVQLYEGTTPKEISLMEKQNYLHSVNLFEGGNNNPNFIGPKRPENIITPYGNLEYAFEQKKTILDNKKYDNLGQAALAGFGNTLRYADAVDLGEVPKPQGLELLNYYASRGLRPFYNLPLALSGEKIVGTTTENLFGNAIDAGSGEKSIELGLSETWNKVRKEPLGALVEFPAEAALWITGGKAVSLAVQGITKGTKLIKTNPSYLMSVLKPRELGSTVFIKKSKAERISSLFSKPKPLLFKSSPEKGLIFYHGTIQKSADRILKKGFNVKKSLSDKTIFVGSNIESSFNWYPSILPVKLNPNAKILDLKGKYQFASDKEISAIKVKAKKDGYDVIENLKATGKQNTEWRISKGQEPSGRELEILNTNAVSEITQISKGDKAWAEIIRIRNKPKFSGHQRVNTEYQSPLISGDGSKWLNPKFIVKPTWTQRVRSFGKLTSLEKARAEKLAISQKYWKNITPTQQNLKSIGLQRNRQRLRYTVLEKYLNPQYYKKFNRVTKPSFTSTYSSMGTSLTGIVIRTRGTPQTKLDLGPSKYEPSKRSNEIDFKDNAEGISVKDLSSTKPSKPKPFKREFKDDDSKGGGFKEIKTSSGILLQKVETKLIQKTQTNQIQKTIQKTELKTKLKTPQITKLRLKSKTKLKSKTIQRTAYSTALIQSQRTGQKLMSKLATKQIQRKKLAFKPAYKVVQKPAIKPMLKQKAAQKTPTKLIFKQDLIFPPIIEVPLKFVIPPPRRTPPRRPGIIPLLRINDISDRDKRRKRKTNVDFLGNTRVAEITGFRTKKTSIEYGKRTQRLFDEDLTKSKRNYKKSRKQVKNILGSRKTSTLKL